MPSPIRVLCVDDNENVGLALQRRLALENGLEFLGQLSSANELVPEVRRLAPDVVLLDIDMPGRDPFEALRELALQQSSSRVVMLSGHVRPELIDQAFEAGAWGYLSKNESTGSIVEGVRRAAAGELVLSEDVKAALG